MSVPSDVGEPRTILIVEDDEGDAEIMRTVLRQSLADIDLRVVRDGKEALRFLRREREFSAAPRANLVILDLNLPGRDGRDVLADMKADSALRRIPVLVLTSSQAEEDVRRMYDLHANSYIVKSPDPERCLRLGRLIRDFWLGIVQLPPR